MFWYIPVYLVKYNIIMLRSDVEIYQRVFNCFMAIAMACMVFWVLHYRELGRFFQQQKLINREKALLKREY